MAPKRGFPLLRTIFIFVAIALPFAILIVPRLLIERNLKTMLSSEEYQLLERYRSEPFHLDPKWKNPKSEPEDLTTLREEFFAAIPDISIHKEIDVWLADLTTSVSEELWTSLFESFVEAFRVDLEELEAILLKPEVTYNLLDPEMEQTEKPNQAAKQSFAEAQFRIYKVSKVFLLRSHMNLRNGDPETAFEDWFLATRLARKNPYARVMQQMMASGILSRNLKHFSPLVDQCQDTELARNVLTRLTEMRPMVCNGYFEDPIRAVVLDLAGLTEEKGGTFEFLEGEPARESARQIWSPDSPVYQGQPGGGAFLGNAVKRVTMSDNPLTRFWQLHDMMLAMSLQNMVSIRERERIFQARFDLACLYLANRIRELEGKDLANSASDLVPEFFEEEPLDPFTEKAFLWSSVDNVFYSVGPDGEDDELKVEHQMGNSKNPVGDISLP